LSLNPLQELSLSVDQRWFRDVNDFARGTPWLHDALSAYALWGGLAVLALMLVAAYLLARRRADAPATVAVTACAGLAVLVALLVNQHAISPVVGRQRPCRALSHVEILLTCSNDYSFPSDHCMIAGAFTAGLAFISWRWAVSAGLLAVLLAFTRVYVGAHYPSDVVAGLVIDDAIGTVVVMLTRPLLRRLTRWLTGTRLRSAVVQTAEAGRAARSS
jgi:undecaprenyl-diphosphatase